MWRRILAIAFLLVSTLAGAQGLEDAAIRARSKDAKTRLSAIPVLATIHEKECIRLIAGLIGDRDREVRYQAAKAFPELTRSFIDRINTKMSEAESKDEVDALRSELVALDEFRRYSEYGRYLADVVRGTTGTDGDFTAAIEHVAKGELWTDDPPEADEVSYRMCCVVIRDGQMSIDRIVSQRPSFALELIGKRTIPYRSAIIESLGRIGYSPAYASAVSLLISPNASLRISAIHCLSSFGGRDAFNRLSTMRFDPSSFVRYSLAGALCSLDAKRAVRVLVEMSDDPLEAVRDTVFDNLSQADDDELAVVASELPAGNDHQVRKGLKLIPFGRIGRLSGRLVTLLRSSNPRIREDSARCLGLYKDVSVQRALVKATKDKDADVRLCAIRGLGERDNPEVWDTLIEALKDKSERLVCDACSILAELQVVSAIAPLQDLLKHKSKVVRDAAQSAILALQGESEPQATL